MNELNFKEALAIILNNTFVGYSNKDKKADTEEKIFTPLRDFIKEIGDKFNE